MNADLKDAFSRIKPVCDALMVRPTAQSIATFNSRVSKLKKEVVQELQQYMLFPLITHVKSTATENDYNLQQKMVDSIKLVLEKVKVNAFEMCLKLELGLIQLVFDHNNPGMIAAVPEELKLSVMNCLTVLMLNMDIKFKVMLMRLHVPLLAKAVYVSVHIAKIEKLRPLRLAAIRCVTALTATHAQLTNGYNIPDPDTEKLVVDMLSMILPGVLGALQDVAVSKDNPGHLLVVASLDAMHRILCLAMNNKFMPQNEELTVEDFAKMMIAKKNNEVSNKAVDLKKLPVRSPEWFNLAGRKLLIFTRSLITLRTHEHPKVRKELAIFSARLLFECNISMHISVPLALDTLIALSKDEYPEVSEYCANAVNTYITTATDYNSAKVVDLLCDNFFYVLNCLPRVMNNIDSNEKLSSLNLLHGYVELLSSSPRPDRLTAALSSHNSVHAVCVVLVQCATMHSDLTMLTQHAVRDITSSPPTNSPWCKFRHLDNDVCERRLQEILCFMGNAGCASLLLDRLLELFNHSRQSELVYICNWMATGPNSTEDFVKRILDTYIEEDVWYLPLEVSSGEANLTEDETLDVSVYNPRAWYKDSVPDLYEGAVETRYTDISYQVPRARPHSDPNTCATLGDAQRNMLLSCLLTEGLGMMARRLMDKYQPYLLKTLCLVLERVGSKYEMLHLAGLKAIHDIAVACGHATVTELIKCNADYFTNQVTIKLKKAWDCQSALQILSVVMEYSDSTILNYLYGIVEDVLVQSCDKFYEKDLYAYLQVFLTFVECIRKWYTIPQEAPKKRQDNTPIDVMHDLKLYLDNKETEERLLNDREFEEETGKSVEEMYREDMKRKEEDMLDYDDTVTEEKPPPPQYVVVTVSILKRCLNYVTSSQRDNSILALQVLNRGLPILRQYEDELLPLVHLTWAPLVNRFDSEPAVMKRAFDLLVTMAELSRDFIRNRAVKDVLPHIYKFLHKSSKDSYLKDVGSCYRSSQAYELQVAALGALPHLATLLLLVDEPLEDAMTCVQPYLSKKQPKVLQSSAVEFFKTILEYDYGAAWYHLRQLCNNDQLLTPTVKPTYLLPIRGTPYLPKDKDYENNIKLIFDQTMISQ